MSVRVLNKRFYCWRCNIYIFCSVILLLLNGISLAFLPRIIWAYFGVVSLHCVVIRAGDGLYSNQKLTWPFFNESERPIHFENKKRGASVIYKKIQRSLSLGFPLKQTVSWSSAVPFCLCTLMTLRSPPFLPVLSAEALILCGVHYPWPGWLSSSGFVFVMRGQDCVVFDLRCFSLTACYLV